MFYGRTGKNLEIDLSVRNIQKEECAPEIIDAYLGGRGVCTKILWDRVDPEVDAFSEDNLLIFGTGLLTGTLAPGANRTVLVTRSPQTNLLTYSSMGGFWAPELKQAGYDNVIVSGKSSDPVYLWIFNDRVEIRSAKHLWGKDVKQTQDMIREEVGEQNAQIMCIGQAGENKVFSSSIEHSTGASFSRAGVGALMGDKKLKAIAVRGTKDVIIANPSNFYEKCLKIQRKAERIRSFIDNWSYERQGLLQKAVYGNLGEFRPLADAGDMHNDFINKYRVRQVACYNCTVRCKHGIRLPEGTYSVIKCVPWFSFMACCKIQDLSFGIRCYNLCEKFGFDALSSAHVIAFAIDLYQKRILTKEDTEGLHLEYGNAELAFEMIRRLALREGIGNILANGVYEAARLIGRGAEKYAYHVKKLEIPIYPLHHPYLGFVQSIDDRADMLKAISAIPQHYFAKAEQEKREYINSEFWPYPPDYKDLIWDDFDPEGADYERITKMVSFDVDSNAMADLTGICIFWTGFFPFNPYLFEDQVKLVSYATGNEIDQSEGIGIARRVGALVRSYNVRLGISRKDDQPPERFFREPSAPPLFQPKDRGLFNKALDSYYELRGYNHQGIPTKRHLEDLKLGDVYNELVKGGILTDEENHEDAG